MGLYRRREPLAGELPFLPYLCSRDFNQVCYDLSSFCLHAWDYVGVLLHGEGWVFVAEAFADDLDGDACFEGDRSVRMSEVVLMPTSA